MNETFKNLLENTKDACYCPFGKCHHNKKNEKMQNWMKSIKKLDNTDNKQGLVYMAYTKEFGPVIIKHLNKPILIECGKREILSGFQINPMKSQYFVETLGYFYRKSGFYVVTKYVFGDLLRNTLKSMLEKDFINLLLQICIALEMCQEKFLFTHYDLHTANIIVQPVEKISVLFDQYKCTFSNTIKPVIIDFGMSCGIDEKGNNYGQKNLEEAEIYDRCQPGYDIYTFLIYCTNEVNENLELKECIKNILTKFFKNNKNYRLCLQRGASSKTPKQFFQYLIRTYKPKGIENRRQFELQIGVDSKKLSFIDHHYYKRPKNPRAEEWIKNDLNLDEPMEVLMEKYWKMKYLKLPSKLPCYRMWEKQFLPMYNKYWKDKIKTDVENRNLHLNRIYKNLS
jgi:hypothetical protein